MIKLKITLLSILCSFFNIGCYAESKMPQEMKIEALAQLDLDVRMGFDDEEMIHQGISDMFYDDPFFDKVWLDKEINIRMNAHEKLCKTWKNPTDFDRLVKVFDVMISQKIVALHKAGYTRSDAIEDSREMIKRLKSMGIHAKGFVYYHTQDLGRILTGSNVLYIGYDSYNNDDILALEVAKTAIKVLKEYGFKVKWDGSLDSRIEVLDIVWKKCVDDVDYNEEHVIDVIKQTYRK